MPDKGLSLRYYALSFESTLKVSGNCLVGKWAAVC